VLDLAEEIQQSREDGALWRHGVVLDVIRKVIAESGETGDPLFVAAVAPVLQLVQARLAAINPAEVRKVAP